MLQRHFRTIGSWLGLLAILMATLAPTVSQALAMHDRLQDAMDVHCMANGDNAMAMSMTMPVSMPQATTASDTAHDSDSQPMGDMPGMHWQACGYCGLLAHFPVAPTVPLVFAQAASFRHIVEVHASVGRLPQPPQLAAQPRAPPVVL